MILMILITKCSKQVDLYNYLSSFRCQNSCTYESYFDKIVNMSAMVKYKENITNTK